MVERLAHRYGLSENTKSQMLHIMDNSIESGEYALTDVVYSVIVVKRETDFDVKLFRASITGYTKEGAVRIDRKLTV